MARLQATATALAQVMTPSEAGRAVLEQALSVFGAEAGAVYLREDNTLRPTVEILGRRQPFLTITIDDVTPLSDAVLSGEHRFYESREQILAEYPAIGPRLSTLVQASVVLVLAVKGRVFGAIALSFESPRELPAADRVFADAIAAQCALAIDRAVLIERERAALERADLLANATALLASTLDTTRVLQQLLELLVPRFADWCAVEMVEGDTTRQIAVAHADPEKVKWGIALRERFPPDRKNLTGIHQVIATGKAELHPYVPPHAVVGTALDPEHARLLEALNIYSVLLVPLVARGRVLGGLSLVWAESKRSYTQVDLELFSELARRAALAIDNATLYRDMRKAVEVRDDFLAAAGHELKTPLAALMMQIESVTRALDRETPPAQLNERLKKASRAAGRLEKLIDDLLDVSRITAGRLHLDPEPLALDEVVKEVVDRFLEQAQLAGCDLTLTTEPAQGVWDRLRIDQVASNLVANAIKYGRGAPITVSTTVSKPFAVLRVTDRGIGIAREEQQRIFERFERVVENRSFGGFGLGLWIARQIVEASGGTIGVASNPGEGATFTVMLPMSPPHA